MDFPAEEIEEIFPNPEDEKIWLTSRVPAELILQKEGLSIIEPFNELMRRKEK